MAVLINPLRLTTPVACFTFPGRPQHQVTRMTDLLIETTLIQNLASAEQFTHVAMALLFGVSFFANALALQWRVDENRLAPGAIRFARASFLCGTAFTVATCTLALVSPAKPIADIVVLGIAMVLAVVTLVLDRGAQGMPALSFLSGAVIWLLTVVTPFFMDNSTYSSHPISWLSGLHITTAVGGEALFVLAFCTSLLYLWDYRRLKSKHLERRPAFPSLDTLDKLVGRASHAGLFLISTSLVSGIALVFHGSSLQSVGSTKIVWAFMVWGWYVLALFGRGFWGWRGRKGAQLSLWGTLLMLCALFGTVWNLSE